MDPAWIAIIVTIVIAVIAGLVGHVLHDAKAHERIAKLEEWRGSAQNEIGRISKNVHDLRDRFFQRKE